jgi:hypothetical protein
MKIKREQTANGWRVTLTHQNANYVGTGETLKNAMDTAFMLVEVLENKAEGNCEVFHC